MDLVDAGGIAIVENGEPSRAAALRRPTSSARSRAGWKRGAISGRSLPLHSESTFRQRSRRATSQVVCSRSRCLTLG